jgi:hypothetical protein
MAAVADRHETTTAIEPFDFAARSPPNPSPPQGRSKPFRLLRRD